MEVESAQLCPDNSKWTYPMSNFKFVSLNRTHKSLSVDFTFTRPIDELVGGGIKVEKLGNAGWVEIPFATFSSNLCKNMLRYFRPFWIDFYKKAGVENPDKCPIPAVGKFC